MGLGPELVDLTWLGYGIVIFIIAVILLKGIRIIRPTTRAAVETLGKYTRFQKSGITYIVPIIQKMYSVNITERLVDVTRQEVITKDNLNCTVDAQVYFKVGDTEEELKFALYKVNDYHRQIVQLARTTLRNVIGDNDFKTVNSQRGKLNVEVFTTMEKETAHWGINIVRVELKEIEPPKDVQDTMNMVIKAENDKQAAIDFANATETKADGDKRARIQTAKGIKESQILEAEGEAKAIVTVAEAKAKQIELVNSAADKYFKGNAQLLEKLQVTRDSLDKNSKIILTKDGISPTLVINESDSTVIPTRKKQETQEKAE
ncbi:stomatin [archaeon MnTg01]|nr:stomatin [archaeon MnTg01]